MSVPGRHGSVGEDGRTRSWWHLQKPAFFAVDYVLGWLAVQAAFQWSPRVLGLWHPPGWRMTIYGLPLAMAIGLQLLGVQINQAGFRGSETLTRILIGTVTGALGFVVLHALVGYELIGRYILGITLLLSVALVLLSRFVIWRLAEKQSREVFMLGSDFSYRELMNRVGEQRLPIRFVGRTSWRTESDGGGASHRAVAATGADEFVVENPEILAPADRRALMDLVAQGRRVIDLGYFYESELTMVHVGGLKESWFWSYDPAHTRPVFFAFKRCADIVGSVVGLVVTLPVALLCAGAILLEDGQPVVYSQTRVGWRNRPFVMRKFRTMRMDAEAGGPQWAAENDDRVTRVGRFLRRTRLDEIPQFWNILRGEMSFIGPRPERPEMMSQLEAKSPYYRLRHIVKPGLTGWAQVNYHYAASIEETQEKLAYDLYYIKYASLMRELHIILRTISTMTRGR